MTLEAAANPSQSQTNQVDPILIELLGQRGYKTAEEIEEFFSQDLRKLPDLTDRPGLKIAANRIIEAIDGKELIGIYGDYDVDGTTSCALFYHFFDALNIHIEAFQPSRFDEGYGLHCSSIDQAIGKGIKLLITVDCGITNSEAADYAKERGLDLIITDHHKDILPEMPNALAVVNPNRRDVPSDSPLRNLAGVGVAFATCLAIRHQLTARGQEVPSLYPLLQFVAVGTICDLVPLNTMNFKLVRHGLKQLPQTKYCGLKAFLSEEERKLTSVPSEKLSFGIGPMINSKGRVDHPEKALQLLTAMDSDDAFHFYSHLDSSNKQRKQIQAEVYKSAKDQVIGGLGNKHLASIIYNPQWHEGVIGIVASRLVEQFKAPAIVFTDSSEPGIIKASARTAGALSIFDCLEQCQDLFIKFGGHKAAAGLSMPVENFDPFKTKMNEILANIPEIERTVQDYYDLEIDASAIHPALAKQIEKMEPFGQQNPLPVFKINGLVLEQFDLLKDIHVRWNFKSEKTNRFIKGISFNYIGSFEKPHPQEFMNMDQKLTVYATIGINYYRGNEYLQLMVQQVLID